jgi:hypothetical protein
MFNFFAIGRINNKGKVDCEYLREHEVNCEYLREHEAKNEMFLDFIEESYAKN